MAGSFMRSIVRKSKAGRESIFRAVTRWVNAELERLESGDSGSEETAGTGPTAASSRAPERLEDRVLLSGTTPTLTTVTALPGATENSPFSIPYATLKGASDAADTSGAAIQFRIDAVTTGATLKKNGVAVVPNTTLIAAGDTLTWTNPTNTSGTENAFTVEAYNGTNYSGTPVQVQVAVQQITLPPTITSVNTLTSGNENTPYSISYSTLLAASQGVSDPQSLPISFQVGAISTGTLTKNGVPVNPSDNTRNTLNPGEAWVWTPPANASGSGLNAFTVKTYNGQVASGPVQVKVNVAHVNQAPTLTTISTLPSATENQAFSITYATLSAASDLADVDGTTDSFKIVGVTSGTLTKNGTSVTAGTTTIDPGDTVIWTPAANASGVLPAFTVVGLDSGALTSTTPIQVNVTVAHVNQAPVLNSIDTFTGATENAPFAISYDSLAASSDVYDVDSSSISFKIAAVSSGTLTDGSFNPVVAGTTLLKPGGVLYWTPPANTTGNALNAFTVKANDGALDSANAVQVKVNVAAETYAPTLTAVTTLTGATEGAAFSIPFATLAAASNKASAGGASTYFRIESVSGGTLTKGGTAVTPGSTTFNTGDTLVWTPPPYTYGPNVPAFTVRATDGTLLSSTPVPVKVAVTVVKYPPQLTTISTLPGGTQNQPLTISYNTLLAASDAYDPDGSTVSFQVAAVSNGTTLTKNGAAVTAGTTTIGPGDSVVWTPATNANGVLNAFTVKALANTLTSASAVQVAVNVSHVRQAPVLTALANLPGGTQNQPYNITYAKLVAAAGANQSDADGATINYQVTALGTGTLTQNGIAVQVGQVISSGTTLVWTPVLNAYGTGASGLTAFSVKATDGALLSATSIPVKVDVTHVNQAPTMTTLGTLAGGTENRAFSIPFASLLAASNAGDVDSTVQFRVESVTSGTLTLNGQPVVPGTTAFATGQTLVWTPANNAYGNAVAAFTVRAWDGAAASAAALPVNVALAHVNQPPTLSTITTFSGASENAPFTIPYASLLAASNAADPDSTVQFQISAVSSGTLTKNGAAVTAGTTTIGPGESLVWTPALNTFGNATGAFTVKATDGSLTTTTAVAVLVNVAHVNQAPTMTTIANLPGGTENQPYTVNYAALKAATDANDVDPNTTLTFQIAAVSSGTLTKGGTAVTAGTTTLGAGESLTWTPPAGVWGTGYAAPAAFTVKAYDGTATSANALTVRVDVANVDQAPTLTTMANFTGGAAATENTPYTFTHAALLAASNAADVDSYTLGFRVQTIAAGSKLTKNGVAVVPGTTTVSRGDSLIWTPPLNANGSAQPAFTVEAYDGTLASSTPVPVTIDITQVNQPPTLTSVTTVPGATQATAFTVPTLTTDAADPDGAAITYRVDSVDDGTLTINSVAATPGTSTFNNTTDSVVWTPGAQSHGNVTAFHISAISNGIASLNSVPVVISVTPAANALTFGTATSISGGTENTPITITYSQLLTASGAAETNQWLPLSLRIDSVTANSTLTKNGTAVTTGAQGTLVSPGDSIVWTPPSYVRGNASNAFVVRAYDGTANSSTTQQIQVDLAGVDHPPTLSTISTIPGGTQDTQLDIGYSTLLAASNAANPDSNPVTFRIDSVVNGTVQVNGTNITPGTTQVAAGQTIEYTPASHMAGTNVPAFTVEASDGTLFSGTPITVNVNLAATAHAPTLTTISTLTTGIENTPLTISYADLLANSDLADIDGTADSFQVVAVPTGTLTKGGNPVIPGTTTLGPGESVVWTPATNASGNAIAAFTVQGYDGALTSTAPVPVTVNVAHVAQLPTLTTVTTLTNATENAAYSITYSALNSAGNAANVENDAISYRVESITSGTLTKNGTPVVPGVTLIGTGDTVVWTPPLNTSGNNMNAFTIRASAAAGVSLQPVQVKVNVAQATLAPTLTNIAPLTGGGENLPYTISYATLLGASDAFDPNGNAIQFKIGAVSTGTLTKNGTPMVQDDLISAGDTVVWTPAANASGTLSAFTVLAYNGTTASTTPVQVSVNVAAVPQPPTLTTFTALTGASQNTPFTIAYADLKAAGDQADAANPGATINYIIKAVPNGTLTKNGNPVIPGLTRIKSGDTLSWTPPANRTGTINAFSLVATDGLVTSTTPVNVPVTVS